jgi:hypothetical protein
MLPEQRQNLLKLADYLDSLPPDYQHFDMLFYTEHFGECEFDPDEAAAKGLQYLENCGTVACAVGHGPAAGVALNSNEKRRLAHWGTPGAIAWGEYSRRAFYSRPSEFAFLFASDWAEFDNHHYGAAARIRYLLDRGDAPLSFRGYATSRIVELYAPYRKALVS